MVHNLGLDLGPPRGSVSAAKAILPRRVPVWSVAVVKNVGGVVWGNIPAGGLIGRGVDASTGAQYNLVQDGRRAA